MSFRNVLCRMAGYVLTFSVPLAFPFLAGGAHAADQLRVGLSAIYPVYGVAFAARELGYYKERDLDVQLTDLSGGLAQEALAAGAVDVITASPSGVGVAISKGIKERIIAPTGGITPDGWHLVVPVNSLIKTLKDLEGKTVGISSKASSMDFFALWAARHAKITIKTIPLGTPGVPPALKNKQIDAAILWPLVSYRHLIDGEYRSLVDFGKEMEPVLPDTWAATQEAIDKKTEVLRRWLQANAKAITYMQANEAWTLEFLKRYTKETDPRILKMAYDTIIKRLKTDGAMDAQWMANSLALATDAGFKLPPASEIFRPIKF